MIGVLMLLVFPLGPDTTVLIGDSIAEFNQPQWQTGLDDCYGDIIIDARAGRRSVTPDTIFGPIPSGLDAVRAINASGADPDRWVLELGTNDSPYGDDPRAIIDTVLTEIEPGDEVIWISPAHDDYHDGAHAFRRELLHTDGITVADWHLHSTTFLPDGVHPSPAGVDVMIGLVCGA